MFCHFSVILGPYGLSGTLTGVSFRHSEPAVQKLLEEWRQFFPVEAKTPPTESLEPPMPAAVEVVVGEWSLWSPSLSLLHPLFSFCWLIILTLFSLCISFDAFLCILFLLILKGFVRKRKKKTIYFPSSVTYRIHFLFMIATMILGVIVESTFCSWHPGI